MKLLQVLVCCLLIIMPGLVRAFAISFLEPPAFATFAQNIGAVSTDFSGSNSPGGHPILKIWFENDHGKVHSNIFIDFAGQGTLPSEQFQQRNWLSGLPDIHYTIIGVTPTMPMTSTMPVQTQAVPITAIPLPGAAWLFGSGVAGLALLRRRRPAAALS